MSTRPPALVIVPTEKIQYELGLSAPLGWLFSERLDRVRGIYGFQLTNELVEAHDTFIIELNWYLELYEFELLVDFIKARRPNARILFGGLFAALMHRQIFEHYPVDYFIRGDNELPIRLFLDGEEPRSIPNMVGRDFSNAISYAFTAANFRSLRYSLEWFPDYHRLIEENPFGSGEPWQFVLPMVITSKGGCTAAHRGCEYCMGSHKEALREAYGRDPVVMDNDTLITLLRQVSNRHKRFTLYVSSPYDYDLSEECFESSAFVEIDSPVTTAQVADLFRAFPECTAILPLYKEGKMGEQLIDHRELMALEDEHHRLSFPAHEHSRTRLAKTSERGVRYNLDHGYTPTWARWEAYTDFAVARGYSRSLYRYYAAKPSAPIFRMPNEERAVEELARLSAISSWLGLERSLDDGENE